MNINEALADLIRNALDEKIQPLIKNLEASRQQTSIEESIIPYFNLNGAAKYLNVTRQTLTSHIKNGIVKAYRLNGSPRFKKSDLDAAIVSSPIFRSTQN